MSEQSQKNTQKPSQKKARFPWRTFLAFVVLIALAAFLYVNQHLLGIFCPEKEPVEQVVIEPYKGQFREQKILLNEILSSLDQVKSELQELKESQTLLMKRLNALEDKPAVTVKMEEPQEKESIKLAFEELRHAISTAEPFKKAYEKLSKHLSEDDQKILEQIAPYKKIGIPQAAYLVAEFEDVEKELLRTREPDGSWWEKIITRIKRLIRISKKGDPRPGMQGKVDELRELLKLKNFEGVLEKSQDISSQSKEKVTWERHLQAFVEAENTLETLSPIVERSSEEDE